MLKKIILFISFIVVGILYGQQDKQLQATYDFVNLNNEKHQTVLLFIDKKAAFSEFISFQKSKDTIYTEDYSDTVNFKIEVADSITRKYYVNADSITFRDFIYKGNKFDPVIVVEPTPKYNWILKKDTKKIGDFQCSLAFVSFRGRDYNVWYALDIPTPFGPWKFYGLPGLIIEAESVDKSISFRLSKLNYSNKKELLKPVDGVKISFIEYVELKNKEVDDFIERLKAKLPRGAVVHVNSVSNNNLEKEFK